jgi:hypothetical protein
MPGPGTVTLDPWPFDQPVLNFEVPARRVSKQPFASVDEFRQAYRAAPLERLALELRSA